MPDLTKTKRRLRTIKSLNSIFNALQIITIARLQKLKGRHQHAERYLSEIKQIAGQLDFSCIYRSPKKTAKNLAILISPNRGFIGAFNQNLLYRAGNFIREAGSGTEFVVFGRKGADFLRGKKQAVRDIYLAEDYDFSFFAGLTAGICSGTGRASMRGST